MNGKPCLPHMLHCQLAVVRRQLGWAAARAKPGLNAEKMKPLGPSATLCACLRLCVKNSLVLVAAILQIFCGSTPAIDRAFFDVRDFGAAGDGKKLDSPAINAAIATCASFGGGTVHLPAGTYLCGSIRLTNNLNLFLDAGAVILGAPQSLHAYDPAEPFEGTAYQDGGHTYFHNSLIWGEGLTNVSITGPGMINGGGLTKQDKGVGKGSIGHGDKAVALKLCRGVLLRDFTIFHGGHFAILATGCDNMTVDNVTMDTNRDGIDIDCCRNVMVSNCRINSPGDDGLCPKSSYALGRPVITENLTIVNCQVSGFKEGTLLDGTLQADHPGTGRIKFGTEANGGFRNCTVANCTFRMCRGLALEEVDGGVMENITVNNLTMIDIKDYPIYITLGRREKHPPLQCHRHRGGSHERDSDHRPAGPPGAGRAVGQHPRGLQGRRHGQGCRTRLPRTGQGIPRAQQTGRHTRLRRLCPARPGYRTGKHQPRLRESRPPTGGRLRRCGRA